MPSLAIRILLAVLGVCGFLVARHIYKSKKRANPFVCPLKFDCNSVVNSDYSRFLGIPVEIFGMIYYALIALGYAILAFVPAAVPAGAVAVLTGVSVAAFIFSLYLIGIQIFILKKGCSWCIVSALVCFCIFLLTIYV